MTLSERRQRRLLHRVVGAAATAAVVLASRSALGQPPSPHDPPVPAAPGSPPTAAPPPIHPSPQSETGAQVASEVAHGAYIGPDAKLTTLAGSAALLVGAQGGWIQDHVLVLGGSAYALASEASAPPPFQTPGAPHSTLSMTYGGPRIAFVPAPTRGLHLVFGLLAGGGRISSQSRGVPGISDSFVVIEPDVALEANVAAPLRIALGASYRITGGTNLASLDTAAMNGPSAFLAIKVGVF